MAAALALVLAGSGAALAAFEDPDPEEPAVRPLPAAALPDWVVGVTDDSTRRLLGPGTAVELLGAPLRRARQLAGGAVVGLVEGRVLALLPDGVNDLGPADYWVPTLEPDEVWLVRDGLAQRRDLAGRQLGFRAVGTARLRGEVRDGLVVSVDGEIKVFDTQGGARRTISAAGRVLDVAAGRVVYQRTDCLPCPLLVDSPGRSHGLRSTEDPDQLRNPDTVQLSPDGRYLAYTRLLSGQIGNPLASTAQAVVVDVDADRLRVVPRSNGTEWEARLTWVGRMLLFARRLGIRLVVVRVEPSVLRVRDVAFDRAVDEVVGASPAR